MVDDPVPIADLRRALVIKLRHHGDVLVNSPVFVVHGNHARHWEIGALVCANTAPLLTLHPAITELRLIDRAPKTPGPIDLEWRS